jgi:Rod binding domain-containing protein
MSDVSLNPTAANLRPLAKQWVGQTFFGTLMRQARESSFMPEDSPLSGGRGGEAFSSMLDARLAEHAGTGAGAKLADALVDRLA